MKNNYLLIALSILIFSACGKKEGSYPLPDISAYKIKNIDNIGDFIYENGKLVKMGGETFFYDDAGRLESSTDLIIHSTDGDPIYNKPPMQARIETQYSYHWQGNKVKSIMIDRQTYYNSSITSSASPGIVENVPFCEFFYKGDQIDSVYYNIYNVYGLPSAMEGAISYKYDSKNNVSKASFYNKITGKNIVGPVDYPASGIWNSYSVSDYSYDKKINPYNLLYRTLGVILPSQILRNHSPNNPLGNIETMANDPDSGGKTSYTYEYNQLGVPINIKSRTSFSVKSENVNIQYFKD